MGRARWFAHAKARLIRMKPVAKKKTKPWPETEATLEKSAQAEIKLWKELAKERGKVAKAVLDLQPAEVRGVANKIVSRLVRGSEGVVRIVPEVGLAGDVIAVEVEQKYIEWDMLWRVTEILKDFSLVDVQVGRYELPPDFCIECGEPVKSHKKKFKSSKPRKKVRNGNG